MAEDTKNTAKIHVKNKTKPFQITVEKKKTTQSTMNGGNLI